MAKFVTHDPVWADVLALSHARLAVPPASKPSHSRLVHSAG
jgi:hypothetical protein